MKLGRKNGAGIQFGAGLSGYCATIGQSFVCADLDLPPELHDSHASYIDHWLRVLKSDKSAIIHAASKAEQAARYLKAFSEGAAVDPSAGKETGRENALQS